MARKGSGMMAPRVQGTKVGDVASKPNSEDEDEHEETYVFQCKALVTFNGNVQTNFGYPIRIIKSCLLRLS